jgi:hypothetical protein
MYVILSDLKANKNFQGLYGFEITVTIAIMLIVGSSLQYALSKSSSHPKNKSSVLVSSSSGGTGNSGSGVSKLNGIRNQSSSSPLYLAPSPPGSSSGVNNSGGVASNNQLVMTRTRVKSYTQSQY